MQDDNLIRQMLQPPPPLVVNDTATKKLDRYHRDQRRKQRKYQALILIPLLILPLLGCDKSEQCPEGTRYRLGACHPI